MAVHGNPSQQKNRGLLKASIGDIIHRRPHDGFTPLGLVNSKTASFSSKETFLVVLSKCRQPQRVDALLDQVEEKGRRAEDVFGSSL